MDPTPGATSAFVALGNLHPGADGTAFLLVFVAGLALFIAVVYGIARRQNA